MGGLEAYFFIKNWLGFSTLFVKQKTSGKQIGCGPTFLRISSVSFIPVAGFPFGSGCFAVFRYAFELMAETSFKIRQNRGPYV